MPSREFVETCISGPKNIHKSNYIMFSFGLEVGVNLSQFTIYKDLNGFIGATSEYLLSLNPLNYVVDIDINSNDSYYNFVRNAFGVPLDSAFKCFKFYNWNSNYGMHQASYYFCYDDFPSKNRRFTTLNKFDVDLFVTKFFKNKSWFGNNFITSVNDYYSLSHYTAQFGNHSHCTSTQLKSTSYFSSNCALLKLPIDVSYSITNYENPESIYYDMNFSDTSIITYLVYYVSLSPLDSGVCCLAEIFGITQ